MCCYVTATTAPTGGNDITTIMGNARNLVDKVICAIDAFIILIQSFGKLGNGMGAVFLNPWITGLQAAAKLLQQFLKNIPFLQGY